MKGSAFLPADVAGEGDIRSAAVEQLIGSVEVSIIDSLSSTERAIRSASAHNIDLKARDCKISCYLTIYFKRANLGGTGSAAK